MTFVRLVIAASIRFSSRLSVSATDVDEDGLRTTPDEGAGRRDEGERWQDDLVPRLEIAKQGRHLEGRRAGGSEQHAQNAEALLQQPAARLREVAVAR